MTLLGLYPLSIFRDARRDFIRDRLARGDTLSAALAAFAREMPGAAAVLAFNRE